MSCSWLFGCLKNVLWHKNESISTSKIPTLMREYEAYPSCAKGRTAYREWLCEISYVVCVLKYEYTTMVVSLMLDHTKLSVQFQSWNYWGLCCEIDVDPPLSHYYSWKCWQMMLEVAGVISPSTNVGMGTHVNAWYQ